jgi:hypothetical protein
VVFDFGDSIIPLGHGFEIIQRPIANVVASHDAGLRDEIIIVQGDHVVLVAVDFLKTKPIEKAVIQHLFAHIVGLSGPDTNGLAPVVRTDSHEALKEFDFEACNMWSANLVILKVAVVIVEEDLAVTVALARSVSAHRLLVGRSDLWAIVLMLDLEHLFVPVHILPQSSWSAGFAKDTAKRRLRAGKRRFLADVHLGWLDDCFVVSVLLLHVKCSYLIAGMLALIQVPYETFWAPFWGSPSTLY